MTQNLKHLASVPLANPLAFIYFPDISVTLVARSDQPSPKEGHSMRPPIDDTTIRILRDQIPEFEDHFLDLLDIYDEDLTAEIVFMELADYVNDLVVTGSGEEQLERCLAAVEVVVVTTPDGPSLVAYSFVNEIRPGSREAVRSYFERATGRLAEIVWQDGATSALEGIDLAAEIAALLAVETAAPADDNGPD
jgi:hypothetical protein